MSGALIDLVSKGVQDVYLTGEPQVSFFRQNYKRHTNFSMKPVELNPIGTQAAGSEIVLPIERKGDLLTYVWCLDPNSGIQITQSNPTEYSLHVGGVEIDRQDAFYGYLWKDSLAPSYSKLALSVTDTVQPLHFFHCDSQTTPLPLVAMQYHNTEIRVKHPSGAGAGVSNIKYYACYVMLDTDERKFFTDNRQELLISQVQKVTVDSNGADLMYLNHPVKALVWGSENALDISDTQLKINGTDVFDTPMPSEFFTKVQKYHHSKYSGLLNKIYMYSFALSANEHQPSGTCNFSRLDNAKFRWTLDSGTVSALYAVNYNILVVDQGLTGLKFSN